MPVTDRRPRGGAALALLLAAAVSVAVSGLGTACGRSSEDRAGASSPSPADRPALPIEPIAVPAAPGAMAPELVLVRDASGADRAALTWLEPPSDRPGRPDPADRSARPAGSEDPADPADPVDPVWALRFARLEPTGAWTGPVTVAPAGADTPRFFANWADRPGAVQASDGTLYAHWLAMNGDAVYTYEVRTARSTDGGGTWTPLGRLHEDDSAAEHGFVSYAVDRDAVHAFWLDGRATVRGEPMTLRTVRLGGGPGIDRTSETLLDDSVCDCCSTAAVMTGTGPLVVYRDRTAGEIRDHLLVRGERPADGGIAWGAPRPLHEDGWRIPACPVNGPAAGRLGDTVWVAWFTAADDRPRVLAAVSPDGGRTFGAPVTLDAPGDLGEDGPLGRLDLAVVPADPNGAEDPAAPVGGDAVISWLGRDADGAVVRLRRLGADGRPGPTVDAARAEGSRASGVPRLLVLANGHPEPRLLLAWIDPGGDERPRRIRLAGLPASTVP